MYSRQAEFGAVCWCRDQPADGVAADGQRPRGDALQSLLAERRKLSQPARAVSGRPANSGVGRLGGAFLDAGGARLEVGGACPGLSSP